MLRNMKFEEGLYLNPSCIPHFTTPEQFIEEKIKMLREDFRISVTKEDIEYLKQFETEIQINNAVRSLINKYWDRWLYED